MEDIIWASTQWRGHLGVLMCVVTAYAAVRCLWASRTAKGEYRERLIACGVGSAVLAPIAIFPGLGVLPVMMAAGLVFLAATGVRRSRPVSGILKATGVALLLIPTSLLASGTTITLGSGPSMWPTTSKGFSLMFTKPGTEGVGVGSQIDFRVPMREASEDSDTGWPAGNYHKRIIGMPGDHVVMDEYTISVNGQLVADCTPGPNTEHLKHETWMCAGRFERETGSLEYQLTWGNPEIWMDGKIEWHLGAHEVLVFGDNLVESGDSRHRGPIPFRWILGTVVEAPRFFSWLSP